jgi:hypothetical protein
MPEGVGACDLTTMASTRDIHCASAFGRFLRLSHRDGRLSKMLVRFPHARSDNSARRWARRGVLRRRLLRRALSRPRIRAFPRRAGLNGRISEENETGNADAAKASRCPTAARPMAGGGSESRDQRQSDDYDSSRKSGRIFALPVRRSFGCRRAHRHICRQRSDIVTSHYLEK